MNQKILEELIEANTAQRKDLLKEWMMFQGIFKKEGKEYLIGATENNSKKIILNSHYDTVPPAPNMKKGTKNGKIFGRGAMDALGQIVTIMNTIENTKANLEIHFVDGEETGGTGTNELFKQNQKKLKDAKAAIIVEPTDFTIHNAHRGATGFNIIVKGKSTHMGCSWEGDNALDKAIEISANLKKFAKKWNKENKIRDFPYPIPWPLNIGTFQSGIDRAIVPDNAKLECALGVPPTKTLKEARQEISKIMNKFKKTRLIFTKPQNAPYYLPSSNWLVKEFAKAQKNPRIIGMWASCDARFYGKAGIPTIIWGSGKPKLAHSANEYIKGKEIQKAEKILKRFLETTT